ncbi:GrpB family protein [Natronobiforma cellulositropha]|uniref:GrpB family protein n=1 Tax=Natronobiforma cellulositropha TaxID=1679076 RepID=UPI0021D5EFAB|nr:GrpB family protein [Natronobiforma cellulositropha]
MAGLERGTVSLESPDPAWVSAYERERERLRSIDAIDERVHSFEHVGSTAIEGLAAKPIVDVLCLVEARAEAPAVVSALTDAGYEYRLNDPVTDRHFLAKGPREGRTHYLSVTEHGSRTHREQVAFRDYLRAHPETAARYERLKRTLAARHPTDRASYTAGKGAFVERILNRATDDG